MPVSTTTLMQPFAMKRQTQLHSWILICSFAFALLVASINAAADERKEYIVYMGDRPKDQQACSKLHLKMVREVLGSGAPKRLHYDFKKSFNGFVVKLTDQERQRMSELDGVVSIFPNDKEQVETTRSWDFMSFAQQVSRTTFESDVIIGVFDTGIWPESASFSDQGIGPPPRKWKGICQTGTTSNFSCNNKLIGARYYNSDGFISPSDFASPRDEDGHGTHTASTAAGNLVSMASLLGLGMGTARGGVPSARIAVYKVCWSDGCSDADILAAFEDAIADGVDIISLSLGTTDPRPYFSDALAIGTFHAMKNGILTSTSAGNNGPRPSTTSKGAPWYLSVAASSMDRKFITKVQLGNKQVYEGISVNTFDVNKTMYPLIYAGDAPNITGNNTSSASRFCDRDSLDANAVKGKIVFCDRRNNGRTAFVAGAAGTLMSDSRPGEYPRLFPLPASYLDSIDGNNIRQYINLTSGPTATILKSTEDNDTLAPKVASFSARGPNPITSDILKPDISAPGVNILAAWSEVSPVTSVKGDNRLTKFNIISGTSMSCPHVTGAAAYIKSFYPTWSPAALKSALMTTASTMSDPDAEFAYGAGHLNPLKAVYPGLVYDATTIDYVKFLCGEILNSTIVQLMTGENVTCSELMGTNVHDLNYPSFALSTSSLTSINGIFNRTVTNVGSPQSTYKAVITAPTGLTIEANPNVLPFTSMGQKLSFTLSIKGTTATSISSASLVWDDGVHQVRSPIVVFLKSA